MIPRLHSSGRGVAGLAAYTLHDKPVVVDGETEYPVTSDRVAWTESVGLPGVKSALMVRVMQGTVADAPVLKERAGVSARGRKLAAPYGHMSLNWGPTEQPTREEMVGAAREALSKIGITKKHYALIVAHNDTEHPHVHVVFCRVDPETGKAAKLSHSGTRLSAWAEQWERKHGKIRIENRVARRKVREHNKCVIEEAERVGRAVDPAMLEKMPPMAPARTRDPHGNSVQRTPAERQDWTNLYTRHRAENTPTAQRKTDRLELAMSHLEERTTTLENETPMRPVVEPLQPRPMAVRPDSLEPLLRTWEHVLEQPTPVVMPSRPEVAEPVLRTQDHVLEQPTPVVMPSRPEVAEPMLRTQDHVLEQPTPVVMPSRPEVAEPMLRTQDHVLEQPTPVVMPSRPEVAEPMLRPAGVEQPTPVVMPSRPEVEAAREAARSADKTQLRFFELVNHAQDETARTAGQAIAQAHPAASWPHVSAELEGLHATDSRRYSERRSISPKVTLHVGEERARIELAIVDAATQARPAAMYAEPSANSAAADAVQQAAKRSIQGILKELELPDQARPAPTEAAGAATRTTNPAPADEPPLGPDASRPPTATPSSEAPRPRIRIPTPKRGGKNAGGVPDTAPARTSRRR